MNSSPLDFYNPLDYLHKVLSERKRKNPSYSINAWSKSMGYQNSSLLSDVLRGRRKISGTLKIRLAENLKLSEIDLEHFELICLVSTSKSIEERTSLQTRLQRLHKSPDLQFVDLDKFQFIKEWYHLVILEMVDLKSFKEDPVFLAKLLGKNISAQMVSSALERLTRLGLLTRGKSGELIRTGQHVYIYNEIPDMTLRKHNEEFINMALDSIKNSPVSESDFSGSIFSCKEKDIAKVKQLIRNFQCELENFNCAGNAEQIYCVNLQLFPLTEKTQRVQAQK